MAGAAAAAAQLRKEREKQKQNRSEAAKGGGGSVKGGQPASLKKTVDVQKFDWKNNGSKAVNHPNQNHADGGTDSSHTPGQTETIPGQNGRQRKEFPAGDYDSGGANVILYIGLGMVAMGLVITFVGLGDKGFRTLELKLIGPSLVGCGMFFALLRVLFCTLPSCCKSCMKCCGKAEETEKLLKDVKDKGKPEVRMEAGRVAGRPPGQQARPPGHAVHASSVHDPGDRRSSLGLAASIPGRSDWKAYERRNFEVDQRTHVHSEGPRAPHYVSDSEEEVNHQFSGSLKHERQTKNQRHGREIEEGIKPLDSISNSSSSTFSVNELDDGLPPAPPGNRNFTGSTVNLRTGEIILNATKLQVNEQNK